MLDVFIGWDPREADVADIAKFSIERHAPVGSVNVRYLKLEDLRADGLYTRQTERRNGQLWDTISEAPMSTEFAISRFLTPHLAETDWAVFCDCDFLWRVDINDLLKLADPKYAVMCVHHVHNPVETVKMDNQAQLRYQRKNWSSMILWNCRHPSNAKLSVEMVNSLPGRDLHRFCWLEDHEIGEVPPTWNWLEGTSDPAIDPNVVHYTRGGPWFDEWQDVAHADLWLQERDLWQASLKTGQRASA
ncbi:hypothetical protein HH303_13835 [Rhodospirillaceae bacterium KN72]|uniref:Glycosyltransferase n=1 Tax=Pacificispira spongiicola TaxID=2729598 RepID=A0A7Y0E312_9PROT|nr:hypothetical protein [Pacificispira spongiicola]NMM45571.1 hypothetical protein [Pacificispira spongiicola]